MSATPVAAATVPGSPTLNSATAGNGQVSLTWSAPASNGGAAITSYRATASNGLSCTTAGLGCTITGLTNGTPTRSPSPPPTASGLACRRTPCRPPRWRAATVPGSPTLNSATAGNGQVSLTWSAPASNGGAAITSYRATASNGLSCTTAGLGCTITGLTNGTTYSFTVTATNSVGTGLPSNAMSATPVTPATVPGAPALNSASAGGGAVTLAWSAPASNGGAAITGYTVTANNGASCLTAGLSCTITGLTNGTTYSFTVTATNSVGTGLPSNAMSATPVAAATVPGSPTLNSATAGNGQVSLTWSAPASNGGAAITSYRATASNGLSCTTAGLGCTITGLTNGIAYSFTVTATNSVGTGAASNALSATPVTPATVPGAPALNSASAGSGAVTLAWSAPASNGGAAITSYRATASNGLSCTTAGLSCTITGLTNGIAYSFTVTATNSVGTGLPSNAMSATPVAAATVPGSPTLNSATAGNGQVSLTWSAPASNGGAAITSYTVTVSNGATCLTGGLACTITGLTNGTTYSFTVRASNSVGTGSASNALSATPVAPATPPTAPTLNSAIAGNGQVSLAWSAPASNGGAAITSYRATASNGFSCTTAGLELHDHRPDQRDRLLVHRHRHQQRRDRPFVERPVGHARRPDDPPEFAGCPDSDVRSSRQQRDDQLGRTGE